ncbi:peptidoglycan DD-metalloendopeptidase family protein [Nocardia sp. NPDC058058]|uniref:peptidoglycan DD-metalloendopeptidase family protein n=1 Tax=Nocardia sp. NPDC058058 TaxID=3346317 RepID=UPI0036DC6855
MQGGPTTAEEDSAAHHPAGSPPATDKTDSAEVGSHAPEAESSGERNGHADADRPAASQDPHGARDEPTGETGAESDAALNLAEGADDAEATGHESGERGFRAGVDSFMPGVRMRLDTPGRGTAFVRAGVARGVRAGAQGLGRAREQVPVVRERALEFWGRRPRSRAEFDELVERGRGEVRRQAPVARAWAIKHRVLIGGVVAVLVFAAADSGIGLVSYDTAVEPGVALRVPVANPLQVHTSGQTAKRYLDAINNGERLRESAVVAAAARATLDRAKAEAAAAVAGEQQPWITGPAPQGTLPPGFVMPSIGGFVLPAVGAFTSGFGARWGTFHAGIDIAAPLGSPIYAVAAGTVIDAGPAQGFGLWVRIRHDDGSISVYGHMYDFFVSVGERVPAGMQIARIGNRGDSTGPHLHFEIIINGQHVDPQAWLAQRGISLN